MMVKILILLFFLNYPNSEENKSISAQMQLVEVRRMNHTRDSISDFYNYKILLKNQDSTSYMNYKSQFPLLTKDNSMLFFLTDKKCLIIEGELYSIKLQKICSKKLANNYYNFYANFNNDTNCSSFVDRKVRINKYKNEFILNYHSIVEINNEIYEITELNECDCRFHSKYRWE